MKRAAVMHQMQLYRDETYQLHLCADVRADAHAHADAASL